MDDKEVKFEKPVPEIQFTNRAMGKDEYEQRGYAETCDNCEQTNGTMGKHIITYYAFNKEGVEIERLSLCLECRFHWFMWLCKRPGIRLSHTEDSRVVIDFYGIALSPPAYNFTGLRLLRNGDLHRINDASDS